MVDAEAFRRCEEMAREHADDIAPLPKTAADSAGIAGAIVAGIGVVILIATTGLQDCDLAAAYFLMIGIGFLAPYACLNIQKRAHYGVLESEFRRLVDIERARESALADLVALSRRLTSNLPSKLASSQLSA